MSEPSREYASEQATRFYRRLSLVVPGLLPEDAEFLIGKLNFRAIQTYETPHSTVIRIPHHLATPDKWANSFVVSDTEKYWQFTMLPFTGQQKLGCGDKFHLSISGLSEEDMPGGVDPREFFWDRMLPYMIHAGVRTAKVIRSDHDHDRIIDPKMITIYLSDVSPEGMEILLGGMESLVTEIRSFPGLSDWSPRPIGGDEVIKLGDLDICGYRNDAATLEEVIGVMRTIGGRGEIEDWFIKNEYAMAFVQALTFQHPELGETLFSDEMISSAGGYANALEDFAKYIRKRSGDSLEDTPYHHDLIGIEKFAGLPIEIYHTSYEDIGRDIPLDHDSSSTYYFPSDCIEIALLRGIKLPRIDPFNHSGMGDDDVKKILQGLVTRSELDRDMRTESIRSRIRQRRLKKKSVLPTEASDPEIVSSLDDEMSRVDAPSTAESALASSRPPRRIRLGVEKRPLIASPRFRTQHNVRMEKLRRLFIETHPDASLPSLRGIYHSQLRRRLPPFLLHSPRYSTEDLDRDELTSTTTSNDDDDVSELERDRDEPSPKTSDDDDDEKSSLHF